MHINLLQSSETQGHIVGGEGKSKRATKKSAKSLQIFFVARLDFPSPPTICTWVSEDVLPRTQVLLRIFGSWRKGSWGGSKARKKLSLSLCLFAPTPDNLALPTILCEAPGYEAEPHPIAYTREKGGEYINRNKRKGPELSL